MNAVEITPSVTVDRLAANLTAIALDVIGLQPLSPQRLLSFHLQHLAHHLMFGMPEHEDRLPPPNHRRLSS